MAEMKVILPQLLKEWVDGLVESGQYQDIDEYIDYLIRRDRLVRELIVGEESGISDRTVDGVWEGIKAWYL